MIKNDRQMKRAERKLSESRKLLNSLKLRYSGKALRLYGSGHEAMIRQLEKEIEDYRSLKEKNLFDLLEEIGAVPIEEIGPVLAKLRIAAGLSQKELAERLHTRQSNISRLESGRYHSQSLPQLASAGEVLGIDFTICPRPMKTAKTEAS